MKFWDEFKQFAIKGNVLDLAVGVIIGGAFGKIVSSLVADILTPLLGGVLAGINLKNLQVSFPGVGERVVLSYGNFIENIFDFLFIALAVFWIVKGATYLRQKTRFKVDTPLQPQQTAQEVELLIEIRDLLKQKQQ